MWKIPLMPTTTYFTDQMLTKSSAAEVREQIQSNVVPAATADPASPATGQIYFNSTTGKFRGWNGTAWVDLN